MSTTNELLESLERAADESSIVLHEIDPNTRLINIPRNFLLGVESDERVHRIYFTCPKIVGDNVDLTKLQLRVNYQNANGQKLYDVVDDVAESKSIPGNVIFSWLLSREVTVRHGDVTFTICAVLRDGFEITNEWNTIPTTGRVETGLEPDGEIMDDDRNNLSLIRGDTFTAMLSIEDSDGTAYIPQVDDVISFFMKREIDDVSSVLEKDIPVDTLTLSILPEETRDLEVGDYVYGVRLVKLSGEVHTIIPPASFTLIREVT